MCFTYFFISLYHLFYLNLWKHIAFFLRSSSSFKFDQGARRIDVFPLTFYFLIENRMREKDLYLFDSSIPCHFILLGTEELYKYRFILAEC